jgi:hypothetical protein
MAALPAITIIGRNTARGVRMQVGDEHLARAAGDGDAAGHIDLALAVGKVERGGQGLQFGLVEVQRTGEGFDLGGAFEDPRGDDRILA